MDALAIRVLLIEDNPRDLAMIRAYLDEAEAMRFKLEHAQRLSAGLVQLEAGQTDVVLLDLFLPGSSGLDTFRQAREHSPDVPILVLTDTERLEIAVQAVREGATDYLLKCQLRADVSLLVRLIRQVVDRDRAEQALRESEQYCRQLLAAVTSYTYSIKLQNGRPATTEHGPGSESVTGFTSEDFASDPDLWSGVIHPEDRKKVHDHMARVLAREDIRPIEHRIVHRGGTTRWVRDTMVPHRDNSGRLARYDGLIEDITERKRVEVELRYQRDFAESLIETVQAVVLLLDNNGTVLRLNGYAKDLWCRAPREVLGCDFFSMLAPESDRSAIRTLFEKVLQGHEAIVGSCLIVTKDGTLRDIRWRGKAVRDPEDQVLYVLFTGHDITDLKEAQYRSLQSERLAAIGQMIMGLAHESRNALQRSGACLSLLARVVKDKPKALEYIDRVQAAQDHLERIHGEVREYAKPIILKWQASDLRELLQEAWDNLGCLRKDKQTCLRLNNAANTLDCEVDRFRIAQVFRNILENAIAASSDPVEIDVEWSEAELDGCPAVRTVIRDNGPGLNTEQIKRAFEPFYTTKIHGVGLGLAITRRIVEAHHGSIDVGPGAGCGAKFLITLPRRRIR